MAALATATTAAAAEDDNDDDAAGGSGAALQGLQAYRLGALAPAEYRAELRAVNTQGDPGARALSARVRVPGGWCGWEAAEGGLTCNESVALIGASGLVVLCLVGLACRRYVLRRRGQGQPLLWHGRAVVDDAERRLHAAAETANKMEDAQRRREIEQLDKVVRAASLGSAAVVTAARRRLRDTDQQMETGARNLEIKLTGAELERRRKLEDVAAKARATGTARVEAAAQERKYREDRAEMDAEYRRNQARLASSRAEDAKMLVAGKASMANAEKMRRRQEKEKMESDFCEETRAKLDAKLQDAEKRVEQEGLRLRTKYQGVRREAPPPSDGPNNYFAEHGVLIGGCVAGGLAAVFALSRVLARFS